MITFEVLEVMKGLEALSGLLGEIRGVQALLRKINMKSSLPEG